MCQKSIYSRANSEDPDQTTPIKVDLGLYCFALLQIMRVGAERWGWLQPFQWHFIYIDGGRYSYSFAFMGGPCNYRKSSCICLSELKVYWV